MKSKIVFVISFLCLLFVLCFNRSVEAANANTILEVKLTRVVEFNDLKLITVSVKNNSSTKYSFGWDNSCEFRVRTKTGEHGVTISSGTIEKGTKEYTYTVKASGDITGMYYNDIRVLNSSGTPVNTGLKFELDIIVGTYYYLNLIPLLTLGAIVLGLLIIFMIILKCFRAYKALRIIGTLIKLLGIATILYTGYLFIFKPVLGQADFMNVAKNYWFLWIIGIILIIFSQIIVKTNKKRRVRSPYRGMTRSQSRPSTSSSYSSASSNSVRRGPNYDSRRIQQQLLDEQERLRQQNFQRDMNQTNRNEQTFDEQNRLYQEQAQREYEQMQRNQQMFDEQNRLFQEQAQRDMDQAQMDQQQFIDTNNQNDFNNFNDNSLNDFNNFNDFNDFNSFNNF